MARKIRPKTKRPANQAKRRTPIEREMARVYADAQAAAKAEIPRLMSGETIRWDLFSLGQIDMESRMIPVFKAEMLPVGVRRAEELNKIRVSSGLDANDLRVIDPRIGVAARNAAFALSATTLATAANGAAKAARDSLALGLEAGETLRELTKRLDGILTPSDAKRVARTESVRAYHSARAISDQESEIITGYRWSVTGSACQICRNLHGRTVRLGSSFFDNSNAPAAYAQAPYPPAHPGCECTVVAILDHKITGEKEPTWMPALTHEDIRNAEKQ